MKDFDLDMLIEEIKKIVLNPSTKVRAKIIDDGIGGWSYRLTIASDSDVIILYEQPNNERSWDNYGQRTILFNADEYQINKTPQNNDVGNVDIKKIDELKKWVIDSRDRKILIKIEKASKPSYWYFGLIGETIEVITNDVTGGYYYGSTKSHHIEMQDCSIVCQ